MARKKENIWNLPNALTMIRMLLIPVYWFVFMAGHTGWGLAIFAAASITDLLDGHIARKYQLITDFGKLMDPLADKLMVLSVMLSLAIRGMAPWAALLIILCKEAIMVLGGLLLYKKGVVVYSEKIGKAAQALTVCGLILCFFGDRLTESLGFPLHTAVLWCAVALTLAALCFYVKRALALNREVSQRQDP